MFRGCRGLACTGLLWRWSSAQLWDLAVKFCIMLLEVNLQKTKVNSYCRKAFSVSSLIQEALKNLWLWTMSDRDSQVNRDKLYSSSCFRSLPKMWNKTRRIATMCAVGTVRLDVYQTQPVSTERLSFSLTSGSQVFQTGLLSWGMVLRFVGVRLSPVPHARLTFSGWTRVLGPAGRHSLMSQVLTVHWAL